MKYSQKNSFSRFVPILLVIVITIVAVAAVIAIGQSLFGGGKPQQGGGQPDPMRTSYGYIHKPGGGFGGGRKGGGGR